MLPMNKNILANKDLTAEISEYFKALLFLIFNSTSVSFYILDFIFFLVGLYKPQLALNRSFYFGVATLGILISSVGIIKEYVTAVPKLELTLKSRYGSTRKKFEFLPIRQEKNLHVNHTLVTEYKIFMHNNGRMAEMPHILVSRRKMADNNFLLLVPNSNFLKIEGEDTVRIIYQSPGVLTYNESAHVGTLRFVVTNEKRMGSFFTVPITFGALNAQEKIVEFRFRYEEVKEDKSTN